MLQRIARLAIAAPRRIIGFAVFVFIAAAVFGVPVADSLSPGGFQDPRSESARAIEVLTDKFGQSGQKMLIVVTAGGGGGQPRAPTAHLPARSGLTSSRCCGGRRWFTT
ncbi:transmembrane transport protein mmpL13a [Mycobacterium tuberculosis]|nr:transmembrane transport protein mmpL13a [Mycobacterium tuberculosis]